MAPSLTPLASSTETRKRKPSEELASVNGKRGKRSSARNVIRAEDDDDTDYDIQAVLPTLGVAATKLQQSVRTQRVAPQVPVQEDHTNSSLFDRPTPLVEWKLLPKPVRARAAPHQQQHTTNRFYTPDTRLGQARAKFFEDKPEVKAKIILMMETNLAAEHHGDERCQRCIDRNIPCVRFVESSNGQIARCGIQCAWCRYLDGGGICSKPNVRLEKSGEGIGDKDGETDSPALTTVEVPASSTVNDLVAATASSGNTRPERQEATRQDAGVRLGHSGLSTSETKAEVLIDLPSKTSPGGSSSNHPILSLEDLIGELSEDDAQDAQAYIDVIKRNPSKGRDIKSTIDLLTGLFAPVKQRIAEEHEFLLKAKQRIDEESRRLSEDLAQAAQKRKIFDDAHEVPEVIKIED